MRRSVLLLGLGLPAFLAGPGLGAEVRAAVAANFTLPAEELGDAFTNLTGHAVIFSFGSTGQLYAQISQGAPFDVFLAADDRRPADAVREGFAVEGTVLTYAVGRLALHAPEIDVTDGEAVLRGGDFRHLAIADPATAPYGAAAMETLTRLGLAEAVAPKLVTGENVSQALQFVSSGNAELGFVALGQVAGEPPASVWRVPASYHAPILQDAVLTRHGEDNAAARAFLDFLTGEVAQAIIEVHGYGPPR